MTKKDLIKINDTVTGKEKVLWQDRPRLRTLFFYPDVFSSILGFIWLALTVIWCSIAYDRPVLCICVAVFLSAFSLFWFFKFISRIAERLNTRYFLTENKLFVVYKKKSLEIHSKLLSEVNNPTKQTRKSGYGNIYFFADIPAYRKHSDFYLHYLRYPAHTETVNGFMNIKGADEVYKLFLDAKANSKAEE